MQNLKISELVVHILGGLLFLVLPFYLIPGPTPNISNIFNSMAMEQWLSRVVMLLFFYLNYYIFIPKFLQKNSYLIFGALLLFGLAFSYFLPQLIIKDQGPNPGFGQVPREFKNEPTFKPMPEMPTGNMPPPKSEEPQKRTSHTIYLYCISIIMAVLLRNSRQNDEQKALKVLAELNFLKAQINPHFLFNSLNSIYAMSIEQSKETPNAVLKLASMMRYSMAEMSKDKVNLADEIQNIEDYIALQKMRFGEALIVNYTKTGNFFSPKISPLILMTYIENAFKYGVNKEFESVIDIQINLTQAGMLEFAAKNKILNTINDTAQLGLKNTKERLENIYNKNHKLVITQNNATFEIKLTIDLT